MSRFVVVIAVLLLAVPTTPATVGDRPSTRPAEPPLYSNHPELLPSLGERTPRLAHVWSPHLSAAGLHSISSEADLVFLDHEEFPPEQSEAYAKIIHAARSASPLPIGVYGYGSRLYRFHAGLANSRRLEKVEGTTRPARRDYWLHQAGVLLERLDTDVSRMEESRAVAAAADVLGPSLYVFYDLPPEVVYETAKGQLADAIAEAEAAGDWARQNIRYYQPRERSVVAFVSPAFRGFSSGEYGYLSDEQQRAVLRACRDAGVPPLIWFDPRPQFAETHAAARRMALAWYELLGEQEAAE